MGSISVYCLATVTDDSGFKAQAGQVICVRL